MTPEASSPSPPWDDHDTVLRLYGLTVEMADRISARRSTANSFFLGLQTALSAALGAAAFRASPAPPADRFVLDVAVIAGVVLALAWWLLLRSYRHLSSAKFSVINSIEERYFTIRPFAEEWRFLKRDGVPRPRLRERYTELGFVERLVPLTFLVLYVGLGIHLVFG